MSANDSLYLRRLRNHITRSQIPFSERGRDLFLLPVWSVGRRLQ